MSHSVFLLPPIKGFGIWILILVPLFLIIWFKVQILFVFLCLKFSKKVKVPSKVMAFVWTAECIEQALTHLTHDWYMTHLRRIPIDGTFNNTPPIHWLIGLKDGHSIELTQIICFKLKRPNKALSPDVRVMCSKIRRQITFFFHCELAWQRYEIGCLASLMRAQFVLQNFKLF